MVERKTCASSRVTFGNMATPTLALLEKLSPIFQGAEAVRFVVASYATTNTIPSKKVYYCHLHGSSHPPVLLKHRFTKRYRHPTLDTSLTKARVAGEARMLLKCLRSGVHVPGVRMVDAECGVLGLEWIEGYSVRSLLNGGDESETRAGKGEEVQDKLTAFGITIGVSLSRLHPVWCIDVLTMPCGTEEVMRQIGVEIAKMHLADVIHGDLTTSNMMIRPLQLSSSSPSHPSPAQIVCYFRSAPSFPCFLILSSLFIHKILIDFGLSFVSNLVEDQAVDLYVLERAFASTHPDSEALFEIVLDVCSNIILTS